MSELDIAAILAEFGTAVQRKQFRVADKVVNAVTNDSRAMLWADTCFAPWASTDSGTGPVYAWLTCPDENMPAVGRGLAEPVRVSASRTISRGDRRCSLVVTEQNGPWVVTVTTDAAAFRDFAAGVGEVLNASAATGRVAVQAACAEIGGQGVLLVGKRADITERMLIELLRCGKFVSCNRALLGLDDGFPTAWGPMSPVAISLAVAMRHPILRTHVHAFTHFPADDGAPGATPAANRGLELTTNEFAAILDCGHAGKAHIGLIAWLDPGQEGSGARIAELSSQEKLGRLRAAIAVSSPHDAAGQPGFSGTGSSAEIVARFAALPQVSLTGDATAMASAVMSLLAGPSSDPRTWARPQLAGRLVCVMHHIRRDRGLTRASWRTRAVRAGEVHEFLVCRKEDVQRDEPLQDAWYVGFAALESCILAVGDAVWLHGRLIGEIAGFNDTHLPNHMNVILASPAPRTGRELGALVGDSLIIRPPFCTDDPPEVRIAR